MVCYLCGCQEMRIRPGAVRDDPSLRILECGQCTLVTLSSFEHIAAGHYADSGMHGGAVPPMEAWLRDAEQDDQRRFEMLKVALVNRKALDFGCGAAGFVRKARSLAAEVVGVEPEHRVRDYWGGELKLCCSLQEAGTDYDLITAFHVLEHLPDPRTALRDLASRMAAGGQLIIEVPHSEDALLTLYSSEAFRRFTYWSQHLFLFNAETLRRLAVQAGLRVVSIRQLQRYPLSNHLYWLRHNRPGGHREWSFLDTPGLNAAYEASLAAIGKCDTIVAWLERE
ncbi:MAG: class I SAM-dependent methyltransferase [Steroidobacteraceae bacterium]